MVGLLEPLAIGGAASGLATATAAHLTFNPQCTVWGPVVSRGSVEGPPRVALTFDDGPLPGSTDRILDILGAHQVRAAFFVIGRHAEQCPDLLARMHAEGHLLGNHSYDHRGWGFLRGQAFWRDQLERTDNIIERAIGRRPLLFRPPLGGRTWFIARAASGHTTVTWSRRGLDGTTTTSQRILRRLVLRAGPGEIIALHDGVSPQSRRDPSATAHALGRLIDGLRSRGIQLARLDELAGIRAYREPG